MQKKSSIFAPAFGDISEGAIFKGIQKFIDILADEGFRIVIFG